LANLRLMLFSKSPISPWVPWPQAYT